jgi:hypothetical protein
MELTRDEIEAILDGERGKVIEDVDINEEHRWYRINRLVFELDGQLYSTTHNTPKADGHGWKDVNDDTDRFPCVRVQKTTKTVTVYEEIAEPAPVPETGSD